MLKVFYYYYYLFYTRVIHDSEPHATVVFVMSFIEALFLNAMIEFISLKFFCYTVNKWQMISLFVVLLIINILTFSKGSRGKEIVRIKPCFFNNQKLTIIIVSMVSAIVISWLFWGAILAKRIMENCGSVVDLVF